MSRPVYFEIHGVDPVAVAIKSARNLGATVVMEAGPISGVGTFGRVLDPNGVPIGLLQPETAA